MFKGFLSAATVITATVLINGTAAYAQFLPGLKDADPFNKNSAINKLGVRPGDLSPFHRPRPSVSTLPGFSVGPAPLLINNDYGADIFVTTYHPVNPVHPQTTYRIAAGQMQRIEPNYVYGTDWGITIAHGNGVKSPVRLLRDVGYHDGSTIKVSASRLFR